jgi:ribose transport system substrate-binding protein
MLFSGRNRRIVVALLALCVGGLLAACGSSSKSSSSNASTGSAAATTSASPKKIMVFVFAPRGFNDVTKAWWNGLEQGASSLGPSFDVQIKGTDKLVTDAGDYLNFIQQSLVQKPDGIVVVPNVAAAMKTGLERIASQGIKVLIMDQDVPDMTGKVGFVGTDNKVAGATAAKWMLSQKLKSNEVGVIASTPGTTSTDDRLAGFQSALANSKLKIVATKRLTCGDSAAARADMADMLTANPNLGGVFTVCDLHALGAAQALKAAGKLDVQLASIDASTAGVQSIIKGTGVDAEVAQHLLKVGQTSVETLGKALTGEQVPANTDTGSELVTAANAKTYLTEAAAESK